MLLRNKNSELWLKEQLKILIACVAYQ